MSLCLGNPARLGFVHDELLELGEGRNTRIDQGESSSWTKAILLKGVNASRGCRIPACCLLQILDRFSSVAQDGMDRMWHITAKEGKEDIIYRFI